MEAHQKFIADVHGTTGQPGEEHVPDDYPRIRELTFNKVRDAAARRFPLENERHRLELADVDYEDLKPFPLREQKKAILEGRSLYKRLKGRWRLVDKESGREVSKTNRTTVMRVPWLTDRGTYVRNGHEEVLANQMRLVPGVFARKRDDGTPEAHVNVKQGSGRLFKVRLDPATGVFTMNVGNKNLKLYPIMRSLGVPDKDLEKAWGREILTNNIEAAAGAVSKRSLRQFAKTAAEDETTDQLKQPNELYLNEEEANKLRDSLAGMELDPIATTRTLGNPHANVTPELFLDVTRKLMGIAKGGARPDNRDGLENQRFHTAPDLFAERILKDAGKVGRNLLWKATNKNNLDFMQPGVLDGHVDGLFNESGLAQVVEENNPMDIHQRATRITRMGEGGIAGERTAPMSARLVHNSYKGFVDPTQSPESLRVGLDTQLAVGVRKGSDGLMRTEMISPRTGKRVWVDSITAAEAKVAMPGEYDPKAKTVAVFVGDDVEYVKPSEVDYVMPSGDEMFGLAANLVPLKSAIKAGRLLMAAKHIGSQSVSLTNRERPLVGTATPDGSSSYERVVGEKLGAARAKGNGRVTGVSKDAVKVRYEDGSEDVVELYDNFPFNRKSYWRTWPTVAKGQTVKKGDVLTASNYTDGNGDAAMGTNLRIGYMAHHGENYKDAIVISDSAARKLQSEHMYHDTLPKDKNMTVDAAKYRAMFPGKFTDDQFKKLGPDGVAKPGTVLEHGDPMIVGYLRNEPSVGTLGRRTHVDKAITWEHPFPGTVTDVAAGKNGTSVYVRADVVAREGDKVSARFGNKGVISKIVPDDQMPKTPDGRHLEILYNPAGIPSRVNPAQIHETLLGKVAEKTGSSYSLPGFMDEDLVDFVESELKRAGVKDKEDVHDPISGKTIKGVTTGVSHIIKLAHTAESKGGGRGVGGYTQDALPATGGHEGAKRLGNLVLSSLVAHGASEVLRDAKIIRGQRCFTKKTEVLTRRGWVNWDEVVPEDELYTKSQAEDSIGWYERPESLVLKLYEGELLGYEGKHVSWLVTPDHEFWGVPGAGSRSKPRRKKRKLTAEEIFGKACTLDAYGTIYSGSLPEDFKIHLSADSWRQKALDIPIIEYCRLLGWWLSEGCASINKHGTGEIRISQCRRANPECFDEIESLLRRLGFTSISYLRVPKNPKKSKKSVVSKKRIPRDVIGLRVRSKPLARHLMQLGTKSWNKKLPDIVFEAPQEARLELLRCYTAGDGCVRNSKGTTHQYISSSSELLINGLQRLALISGKSAYLGEIFGPTYKHRHFRLIYSNNLTEVSVVKKTGKAFKGHFTQPYSGKVYCATMSTGLLYVRHDGKAMWSGNCDDFFRDFKLGRSPKMPGTPLVYEKLLDSLRGAGINVTDRGDRIDVFAMTNKEAADLTKTREVLNTNTFDSKTFQPMAGGLFGRDVFGPEGNLWGFIKTPEPLPNPVMEKPLRLLLGLNGKEFEGVLKGEVKLPNGLTGPTGMSRTLAKLDLDDVLERAKEDMRNGSASKRDEAMKRFRYAHAMKRHGARPEEFMLTRIPVLPPRFRPISTVDNMTMVSDSNYLYKSLLEARDDLEAAREAGLPDSELGEQRELMYRKFKDLTGITSPDARKLVGKRVGGLLKWVFGKGSPKHGNFQRNVLGTTMDVAGRSVVTPNSSLKLDEVGMPEEQAWPVYSPFVIRNLVKKGVPALTAVKEVKERKDRARGALAEEMGKRPLIITRAPALHKFSVLAVKPKLIKGSTLQVSPTIAMPLNLDHDGDAASYYVPVSSDAVKEAYQKMLPSRNLLSARAFKAHFFPEEEYVLGGWLANRRKAGAPKAAYQNVQDAITAYKRGEIALDDNVKVLE